MREKIKNCFLPLFLFSFPFQLGKHFWPEWSLVWGIRIDYLSLVVWLTDILFLLCLLVFLPELTKSFERKKNWAWLLFGLGLAVINVLFSSCPQLAVLRWLRVLQFSILVWLIAIEKERVKKYLKKAVFFWLFLSVFLAWAQFVYQGSLGGVFWWLGERDFNITSPGIARVFVLGRVFLRPYASFSHPNSLAGFLLVALILLFSFQYSTKIGRLVKRTAIFLTVGTLFLTFSRTAILTGLIVLAVCLWSKKTRIWLFFLAVLFLAGFFLNPDFGLSFLRRFFLAWAAFKMFLASPIWGVGLNHFIVRLPSLYPDIHV